MSFRMSRTLRFWVEAECDSQDLRRADDKEVAAILLNFEDFRVVSRIFRSAPGDRQRVVGASLTR